MSTLIECGASPFIPGFALKDVLDLPLYFQTSVIT